MKKWGRAFIFVLLVALLAAAAMAEEYRYSTQDGVKVYETRDSGSKVIRKLKKGEKVILEVDQKEIKEWLGILCTAGDGSHMIGWVGRQYLIDHLHSWGSWKVTKKATCTREGEKERTCKICGRAQTKKIKKAEHDFGKWAVLKEATCTSKGVRKHVCRNCGHEERADIKKLPHSYGAWNIIVEATDHSAGIREHVCRNCGYSEQKSYDPEGTLRRKDKGSAVREMQQLLVDQGYLKPGGADGAYGGGTERAVMQFQKDQGLEPDGIAWPQTLQRLRHDYGDWMITVAVARASDGERVRVCKDCGHEERQVVRAEPSIERRQKGGAVRSVQRMLNELGYSVGKADGIYGPKLDKAFETFAVDSGLSFDAGRAFPEQLDALMNAWIASTPQDVWMGQGDKDSPVSLVLRVYPSEAADAEDAGGMLSFDWSVTNLGNKKCTFRTLLMGGDAVHDFMKDDMVAALDWAELKASGANSVGGTFTISRDWVGEDGVASFCAVATDEKSGEYWSSNVETCTLN